MSRKSASLTLKMSRLRALLRKLDGVVIAFSGGVDSTFLAAVAQRVLGENAIAVTARSPTFPQSERRAAVRMARRIGIRHAWIATRELANPRFSNNPENRCYFCKRELFRILKTVARRHRITSIADGSNRDDRRDYRPGHRAAMEYGVISPLDAAGFSKADVRRASLAMGLPTADKPAMACLASRFPYGVAITRRGLAVIERIEEQLHRWGFRQARVRHHGTIARIEVDPRDLRRLCSHPMQARIVQLAKRNGFVYITADLEGYRTGSMNKVVTRRRTF